MSNLRFLNSADQAEFESKGYLVRRLFDADTAAMLKAEFETCLAVQDTTPNQESNYVSAIDFDRDHAEALRDRIMMAWLEPLKQNLSGFRQVDAGVILKKSGDGPVKLHQHSAFTEKPFSPVMFVWCPLADCNEDDGCLQLIPGSHRLVRHVNTGSGGYVVDPEIIAKIVRAHGVALPLKAGEAVFFENSLLHGSFPNNSGRPRLAIGGFMIGEDENLAYYHAHDDHLAAYPMPANGFGRTFVYDRDSARDQPILRRIPLWTKRPNLAQIDALLRSNGPRASEDYDPLETVRHLATPPAPARPPRAALTPYQALRRAISRIPGARFAYRTVRTLAGADRWPG